MSDMRDLKDMRDINDMKDMNDIYPYTPCGAHAAAPDLGACGLLRRRFGILSFEVIGRY